MALTLDAWLHVTSATLAIGLAVAMLGIAPPRAHPIVVEVEREVTG